MTRTIRRQAWVALAAGALIAFGATATPAMAHGGPIELDFNQDGAGGITMLAKYIEDGHPVTDIMNPVATAIGADGTALDPVPLISAPEGQGLWISPEPFLPAGFWTVTVTTSQPSEATLTVNMDVVIADDSAGGDAGTAAGPGWLIWAIVAAAVVLVALVAALLLVRRRRQAS